MLPPLSQDDAAKIQNKIESCIICMLIFTNGTQKRKKMLMILLSNTKKKARFFVLSLKIGDIQGS